MGSRIAASYIGLPALDRQEGLFNVAGDVDLYGELLELFRDEAVKRVEAFRQGVLSCDRDQAIHWAHSLKGAAATLGCVALATLAGDIESHLRSGETDLEERLVDLMTTELERCLAAIGGSS